MNQDTTTTFTSPIRVAYAEDHSLVRATVVDYMIRLGGIEIVIEASNGVELIQQISSSEFPPDVCLLDIMMPKMNGFETIAALKRKWPEMKVVILSGYLTEDFLVRMILAGAGAYLTKNSNPTEIKKAIIEIHNKGLYNTELFTPKLQSRIQSRDVTLPMLTAKEIQLLKYSIEDKTYEEIAKLMLTTSKSIEGHRSRLYTKLGVKTRAGLAMYAIRYGYVGIDSGITPL